MKPIPKTALLLIIFAFLTGCGRQVPGPDTQISAGSAVSNGRASVTGFVSVNMDRVNPSDVVESVSAIYPHRFVAWMANTPPGAVYQVTAELFDSAGKSAFKKTGGYKPDSTSWYYAFDYVPPETPPSAGKWKWRVYVDGVGSFEKSFEMFEPSKTELADLARHQKAREAVLFAFANTWVMSEDFGVPCYFTSITTGKKNTAGQVETSSVLEVSGLTCSFDRKHVTTADLFNGITYRGRAVFAFDVYRFFWGTDGWGEWKDVDPSSNIFAETFAAIRQDLRRVLPYGIPENASNFCEALQMDGYNLVFEITERDGHWFIESNNGTSWVDQRQSEAPRRIPPNAAPRSGFIEEQKKQADSPRRNILRKADEIVKKDKGGVPQDRPDMLKTMKSVRENSL